MDAEAALQKPMATLQPQTSFNSDAPLVGTQTHEEYDPCQNAQKFSPFYMYNHDTPRTSTDHRPKPSIHVSVRDLELGTITPSITQEKIEAQKTSKLDYLKPKYWQQRRQECLTKPKKQRWLQRLPKKQKIAVKLLIAFLVAGVMVGIAVGIASALNSGIYGSNKTVGHPQ